jgi:hypothetical protein
LLAVYPLLLLEAGMQLLAVYPLLLLDAEGQYPLEELLLAAPLQDA